MTHETDMNPQTATVMGSAPFSTETTNTKVTDYVGNKIYEDGVLKKILVDGGYIDMETGEYHFYITDHLGNNRVVAKADGTIVQKNHYYPFGMEFAENSGDSDQPYKYNGKELDKMHGLNMYDYSARYMEPAIGRFSTVDPLAEKYYSISPYAYCANNPIKFIDPTGMSYGDFINEKGKIIGNDGINDGKLYVIKTTEKSFSSATDKVNGAGISSQNKKETEKFIKDNSGNTAAFQSNSIAYDNSIEIEGSATVRQDMVTEISKDNGKGGTSDANNKEYGGNIINGQAVAVTPGAVSNPAKNSNAMIMLQTGSSSYHSHPSGTVTIGNTSANTIGGTTTVYSFNQFPSSVDVGNAGNNTHYVFGRGDAKTYIYNSQGVKAVLPTKRFVNPNK